MGCSIIRNTETNEIERVLAPNGKESKLYLDILDIMGTDSKEDALTLWSQVYTDQFKEWFGDWEKAERVSREDSGMDAVTLSQIKDNLSDVVDENGEPLLQNGFFTDAAGNVRLFYSAIKENQEQENLDYLLNSPLTGPVFEKLEPIEEVTPVVEIAQVEETLPLETRIVKFLEKIGVSIQSVDVITDREGNPLTAVAKADMLNKIIQVLDGQQALDVLPEEAAHFFVEMLGPGHPLMKQMMDQVTSYKIYPKVVEQYRSQKKYRNADGTLNIEKIKKEAIGKVIADHILKFQKLEESDQKISSLLKWWNKLWEFVKEAFSKATSNPFEAAAEAILEGSTEGLDTDIELDEEYYQLADPAQGLLNDQVNIDLDNSVDPRTGQKRHVYKYKGENAKGSVTSVYVDRWLKKIFRSDQRSEKQKLIDLLKADFGDVIHEQIQNIVKSWTYSDGTMRDVQGPVEKVIAESIYKKLNDYIQSVMAQYEPGTKFFSEVKIFDQKTKIGGSIDFLVIQPNDIIDIYDWKSQEIGKTQTDLKTYKETMYRIQLENYRKILELQYGFKKFGKIRSIPMRTFFNRSGSEITGIRDLEVGNIDPSLIPDEKSYLLPVTLRTESTGDSQLDEVVKKLQGIYDKIEKTKYNKEELYKKREELAQLRTTIRDLQLKGKVTRLIDLGLLEYKKYAEMMNNKTLTGKELSDAIKILQVFSQSGVLLSDLLSQMREVIKDTKKKTTIAAFEEMYNDFLTMTAQTTKLVSDLEGYRKEIVDNAAKKNGIFNILNPEAPVNIYRGLFSSLSNIPQRSFRFFSKILRAAQGERDIKFDETIRKMVVLKKKFLAWASAKGMSGDEAMNMILQIDEKGNWNGNFLRKYKPEFDDLKKKAIASGNTKWLVENMLYDPEKYALAEERTMKMYKSINYALNEEENDKIIEKKMKDWRANHKVANENGTINTKALLNPVNFFLKPDDKWLTEKWKNLQKPENAPLKEMYEYFQGLTDYAEELGMLERTSRGFIPSLFKGKLDQIVFGDIKGLFSTKGFFENLEVDSGTQYTPEVDPTDGTIINRIPVYFTRDLGVQNEDGTMDYSKKSRDLFKVFAVWAGHMYNYEAMDSIEDASVMLVEMEKKKGSLVTDQFNNVKIENGQVRAVDKNDRNSQILEEFVNFYLYDRVNGKYNDVKIKVPFVNKEYSLIKTVQAAIGFFSLKTLGLNPISGSANFVGGTGNALFMAQKGKYFTTKSWAKAIANTSGSKKAWAALKYMNILGESNTSSMIEELSLSNTNNILKQDNFYIFMRAADKAVQYPVAIAMLQEHMLMDDKIVNIQDYVKNKYDYNKVFYNLPKAERDALEKKIDAEVKVLQEKENLLVKGKLDKDGNFEIPGLDRNSQEFINFRVKIRGVNKRILGNMGRDDVNNLRTTLLGQAFMQFRNWMPEMLEERFEGLKYDDELQAWTYGKANVIFSRIFFKNIPTLLKGIITGFGDDVIAMAKEKYETMKRDAFEKGEEFTISEGEFIDMYRSNLRSMMLELMTITAFAGAVMSVVSGDDGNRRNKGMKQYLSRALKKYYNEFAFYYNPIEFTRLTKSPLPVIGLAEDFFRFMGNVAKESGGQLFSNEDWTESAKPAKYFFKMVPVAKELMLIHATYDDDFRKEWDIRIQPGY